MPINPTTPVRFQRYIKISGWRNHNKGTLRGFFTAELPSGMIIHDCMLHEKGEDRWISLPSREYEQNNERKFQPIITFVDREAEHKFRDQVLTALDESQPWNREARP